MGDISNRPLILVTNDDGYKARGIASLVEFAQPFGELVVIAAADSQSGQSHSITIKDPIRYRLQDKGEGITRYVVKGTPADGVKLVLNCLIDRKPDLVLSGINHGTNSSSSVVYSGTMAAAIEGAIHQIPSIGFSILDYRPDADFHAAEPFIKHLISSVLNNGLPSGTCLNVNIPAVPREDIKGIKICRQTNGFWKETFETREDPRGSRYAWLTGDFINREPESTDTDEWALQNNYLSVVPVRTDFTNYEIIQQLHSWESNIKIDENS